MKLFSLILMAFLTFACYGPGGRIMPAAVDDDAVRTMTVELLPDMNIPRNGHTLAYVKGELTAIGGHTTGFIPTLTAEYYRDGQWHLLDTFYPHDFGFRVALSSGEVLMGGGCSESFGIGQAWSVESYDPVTHSFSPLPILDSQRGAHSRAALLSDGRIIVAGNWYEEDAVSSYSPESGGVTLGIPSLQRSSPLILQTASDNAIILSCRSNRGSKLPPVADRLTGVSFEVPFLQEWEDWLLGDAQQMSDFFIGDETVGGYAWLFPARRKSDGQIGLIKVVGEDFSLLETERPLPAVSSEGDTLSRYPVLLTDREQKCAWVISTVEGTGTIYVTKVDYGEALRGGKAPVTMYRTDLPDGLTVPYCTLAAILPEGCIACAGGLISPDNYHPSATAFILHTDPVQKGALRWWMIVCPIVLLAMAVFLLARRRTKKSRKETPPEPDPMDALMKRIAVQMEVHRLFLKSGLTKEEVAHAVGSNSRYVSDCINAVAGCSFIDYVNGYRIRYAQRLLFENPDMRLSEISEESGFSSEVTFYRNFKSRTGQTPSEWLASQHT